MFHKENGKLRQVEVSFPDSVKIVAIKNTLNKFVGGNTPPDIQEALKKVYYGKTPYSYTFQVNNLKGQIQRNSQGKIYIGVWEADFH